MGVPIKYRKRGENVINSFDFFDILTGKAYETLYAGKSTITNGFLRTFPFDSYNVVNDPPEANNGVYTEFPNPSAYPKQFSFLQRLH